MAYIGPTLNFQVLEEDVLVALYALLSATSGPNLGLFLETVMEDHLEARAARRFVNEGDEASGKWEELLFPETHEWRESQGFPPAHPINRRTGELMRYVVSAGGTTTVFGDSTGAILTWPKEPDNPTLKEKVRTAQSGKSEPYTRPRPVIAIDHLDLEFMLSALEKWIIFSVENPTGFVL